MTDFRSFPRLTLPALAASCSLIALLAAAPVMAQSLTPVAATPALAPILAAAEPETATVPIDNTASNAPDQVELAALYYYAREGQTARVEAETDRLQRKYPGFALPGDLYAPEDRRIVDETPLWNLYKQNDFAGIDVEIGRMAEKNPGWQPSEDFSTKLARARIRVAMTEAHDRKDWAGVITAAKDIDPKTEPEIDLLWMLIEANRAAGRPEAMALVYQGILYRDTAFTPAEQFATLQKAVDDFSPQEIRKALTGISLPTDLADAVEGLKRDLMRRDVAAFNSAKDRSDPLPAETVDPLRRTGDATDMTLLGWYTLKTGRPAEAETWFRRAMDRKPEAENVKGLYLSLREDKRDDEARDLVKAQLAALADDSDFVLDALSAAFTTPQDKAIDPKVVEAYSTAIQRSQSPDHAEILGWYAYNAHQFEASSAWFSKSWEWKKTENSLKGLALSTMQLKDRKGLDALKAEYAGTYPQAFADLKAAPPPKSGNGSSVAAPSTNVDARYVADFRAKRYGACVAGINTAEARGNLSADARLIKGWCLLELNHLAEARQAFSASLGTAKTAQDAAYGLALTLMRTRLIDEAEAVLAQHPLAAARDKEVRSEIYWQRARSAFDARKYQAALDALNLRLQLAPEPMDMSRLRGWSHYHLGHRAEARAIFTRLNMIVSDSANRQALAVINGE